MFQSAQFPDKHFQRQCGIRLRSKLGKNAALQGAPARVSHALHEQYCDCLVSIIKIVHTKVFLQLQRLR